MYKWTQPCILYDHGFVNFNENLIGENSSNCQVAGMSSEAMTG